jgi:hypothetical protein
MTNVPMILATASVSALVGGAIAATWRRRRAPRSQTTGPGHDRSDATDAAAQATLRAVETLAATSARQAESMQALAEMTAHSMLSATGTYVFQLRDRFDEALPNVAIGSGDHTWRAVGDADIDAAVDGAGDPESDRGALDPNLLEHVEALVFHPGDRVRFTVRFVCNQSPVRRCLELAVDSVRDDIKVHPASYRSSVGHGIGERFEAASDISTFIELPIDVEVGSLQHGAFAFTIDGRFDVTNLRPEGSIAHLPFRVTLRGIVVPDDDGNGLDLVAVEAVLDPERRSYWLDKNERVELTLPTREAPRRVPPQATVPPPRVPQRVTPPAETPVSTAKAKAQYATVTRT